MRIEQFVMAYAIEQDRIRALLPQGFESLRPVLRITTEIRDGQEVYAEFNTPVRRGDRRGWLNIGNWISERGELGFRREGKDVLIEAPFLKLKYSGTGAEGGCPAEKDNDGCFYLEDGEMRFRAAERITDRKEFCDCAFRWMFHPGDAGGESRRETLPAYFEEPLKKYPREALTPENAAAIPCLKVLGTYIVRFERREGRRKIAVIFPGIGYTAEKPLLYYAGKLAREQGCEEILSVKYGFTPGNIRGDLEKMQAALDRVLLEAEEQLAGTVWGVQDEILFISKSIGTIAAAAYAEKHKLPARHVLYTPLVYTFRHHLQSAAAFIGTKDPWSDTDEIIRLCREAEIPVTVIPEANHSLETGDSLKDLRILADVMEKSGKWMAAGWRP